MNDRKRAATVTWLMQHAEHADLPAHMDDDCRDYAMKFLAVSFDHITAGREPKRLAEITVGILEGEYGG